MTSVETAQDQKLYHVVSRSDWQKYNDGKVYAPADLATDKFIHFSNKDQVLGSANLYFKGKHDLLLLELDVPSKDPLLKWETSPGPRDDLFPHYYGKLPLTAVKKVYVFEPGAGETFSFPTTTFQ